MLREGLLVVLLLRRGPAGLEHALSQLELDSSLAFAVCKGLVCEKRRVPDDGSTRVSQLMCDPFTARNRDGVSWHCSQHVLKTNTYCFSVSALMVPVYLLCRCSSCVAAVYRKSDMVTKSASGRKATLFLFSL